MRGLSTIRVAAVGLGLALAACASGGAATGGGSGTFRDPNVITAAELAHENSPNVYAAIQHLRPAMLQPHLAAQSSSINAARTGSGDYAVHVYMDQTRLGDISSLKTIPIANVKEVRYLDPQQALNRFGSGNPGGVILLVSR